MNIPVPSRFAPTSISISGVIDPARFAAWFDYVSSWSVADTSGFGLTWLGPWAATLNLTATQENAISISGLQTVNVSLQTTAAALDLHIEGLRAGRIQTGIGADRVTLLVEDSALSSNVTVASGMGNDVVLVSASARDRAGDGSRGGANIVSTVYLDSGDDRLTIQAGRTVAEGGVGNDTIAGGIGADMLLGDGRMDMAGLAVSGHDVLLAGAGNDSLMGDWQSAYHVQRYTFGNDTLEGGAGNDLIYGDVAGGMSTSLGSDLLVGGAGDDRLFGDAPRASKTYASSGADSFVFGIGHGRDRVEDFDSLDTIVLSGIWNLRTVSDVLAATIDSAEGALITTSSTSSILLVGVKKSALAADDFVIV
jgi:Ca2+-binding RTX toxin-like protein